MTTNNNFSTFKQFIDNPIVQQKLSLRLGENEANIFSTSLINIVSLDNGLASCNPKNILDEALKSTTLKLSLNKSLGLAYIYSMKNKKTQEISPVFAIGYRGWIQLALRTNQYKYLNAEVLYEGETYDYDKTKGIFTISGHPVSEEPVAYFAYMQLLNGFEKGIIWSREKMIAHAEKYVPSFKYSTSKWKSEEEKMGKKTMLKRILTIFGVISVEMQNAISMDSIIEAENQTEEIEKESNSKIMDMDIGSTDTTTGLDEIQSFHKTKTNDDIVINNTENMAEENPSWAANF